MMDAFLVGDDHLAKRDPPTLFTIGQLNPHKGFVHVFDDATLDIVMQTLDTVSDFVTYLSKKEALFTRGIGVIAAGEEEILAHYLHHLNAAGEHDFEVPPNCGGLFFQEGTWQLFCIHPQRRAQIEANQVSYLWDQLIEKFSYHIMTATQQYTSSSGPHESEILLRFLAAENRTRRRMLAHGMLEVINKANERQRFVRIYQSTKSQEPYYVFLSLPSTHAKSEDEYREVRRGLLEAYLLVCKRMNPDAQDIVGIAISPTSESDCSEDLLYLNARDWTAELAAEAESLQADLKILQNVTLIEGRYSEYPKVTARARPRFVPNGRYPRNAPCGCGSGLKYKKCCIRTSF